MAADIDFNSHARVGRDQILPARQLYAGHFNSHARVGRDRYQMQLRLLYYHFNSHARVGRDQLTLIYRLWLFDFNSHARVGRDPRGFAISSVRPISTHTPAWGVTRGGVDLRALP